MESPAPKKQTQIDCDVLVFRLHYKLDSDYLQSVIRWEEIVSHQATCAITVQSNGVAERLGGCTLKFLVTNW